MRLQKFPLFVLGFVLLFAPGASAQDACDESVADRAGVLGGNTLSVQNAAERLAGLGAAVRVRTVSTHRPSDSLDSYLQYDLFSRCPAWRGATRSDMSPAYIVVLYASQEDTMGFYYGARWKNALDNHYDRIMSNFLFPKGSTDVAGDIARGLDETHRVINTMQNPAAAPTSPTPPPPAPAPVIVQTSGTPADLFGLWLVLGGGLFLLTIAGVVLLLLSRKKERERRAAAQLKAQTATTDATALQLESRRALGGTRQTLETVKALASAEDVQPLESALAKAETTISTATMDLGNLTTNQAVNPDRPGLSVGEYEEIEKQFNEVREHFREALTLITETEQKTNTLLELANTATRRIEEAGETVHAAEGRVAAVRTGGYRTDAADETAREAAGALEEAASAKNERRFNRVAELVSLARKKAAEAAELAESFPLRREETLRNIGELETRLGQLTASASEGERAFERISSTYAEACWEAVQGNAVEVQNRLNWSRESLDEANAASTMERQEWDEAGAAAEEVTGWLNEAESYIRSITALEENLGRALRDAPAEVEAAGTDIRAAREYIETHDPDIAEELETDLQRAVGDLQTAEAQLRITRPNCLLALELAQKANAAADKILAEARGQYETAHRLRLQVESGLRDAKVAISRAEEYIQDHRRDVTQGALQHLEDARTHLQTAHANLEAAQAFTEFDVTHHRRAAEALASAKAEGTKAYERAQSDFQSAERSRRAAAQAVLNVATEAARRTSSQSWGSPSSRPSSPISGGSRSRSSGGGIGGGSQSRAPSGGIGGGSRSRR